jgi:hypothetical protein
MARALQVTFVTIAKNNGRALALLSRKRGVLMQVYAEQAEDEQHPRDGGDSVRPGCWLALYDFLSKLGAKVHKSEEARKAAYPVSEQVREDGRRLLEADAKQIDANVKAMVAAGPRWRYEVEKKAEEEAGRRSCLDRAGLLLQRLGFARNAAYYRYELSILNKRLQRMMKRLHSKPAKVARQQDYSTPALNSLTSCISFRRCS